MIERTLNEISEKLGVLRAASDRGTEDRAEIKDSINTVHRRLDGLVGLPEQFTKHERLDNDRHTENIGRLDAIEKRLGSIEGWRNRSAGARAVIGKILAAVISVLGLVAAWWKLR